MIAAGSSRFTTSVSSSELGYSPRSLLVYFWRLFRTVRIQGSVAAGYSAKQSKSLQYFGLLEPTWTIAAPGMWVFSILLYFRQQRLRIGPPKSTALATATGSGWLFCAAGADSEFLSMCSRCYRKFPPLSAARPTPQAPRRGTHTGSRTQKRVNRKLDVWI
jgi:hypothetical protein